MVLTTQDPATMPFVENGLGVLIPPREGAALWQLRHPRNLAVSWQKLYGSNTQ